MSRDGAGTYNLPPGNPVVTETVISSTTHNTTMADVATALTQSISKDGQTTYTANQSMGGFKHTQVADASARNQYATAAQVQDGTLTLIGSVSGTDTLTGTISPAISAYANGVFLTLIPLNNNTGPVTLSLNGLAARPVVKFNSVPLVAGDLLVGVPATLVYNGTNFYLENPQVVASDVARLGQANNFTTNNTFSVAATAAAPSIRVASALPITSLENTAAPADSRSWLNFVNVSGSWVLRADNDAHSASFDVIAASRTGVASITLALAATNITLNGVNASDYPRLSVSNTFTIATGPNLILDSTTAGRAGIVFRSAGITVGGVCVSGLAEGDSSTDTAMYAETGRGLRFYVNGSVAEVMTIASDGIPRISGTPIRDAAILTSGTLVDGRVAQSNVTQHQAAIAINASQITATINATTAGFSVVPAHAGQIIPIDSASPSTITVTADCLGANGKAMLAIRRGAGAVTFSASGVTLRSPGAGTSITVQHGKAALIQMSSTEFDLAGNV